MQPSGRSSTYNPSNETRDGKMVVLHHSQALRHAYHQVKGLLKKWSQSEEQRERRKKIKKKKVGCTLYCLLNNASEASELSDRAQLKSSTQRTRRQNSV